MSKELEALEIINIKLKDKDNRYDRRVVNCNGEYLYLIKEEELKIIEIALKEKEKLEKMLDNDEKLIAELDKKNRLQEQVLEIIKDRFGIQFSKSDLSNYYGVMQIGINPVFIKTQAEFDSLKEVLL